MRAHDHAPTPPFIAWTLTHACPLREQERPGDPLDVERRLRPLRAAAEALRADRVCEGVCLAAGAASPAVAPGDVLGFPLDEVLSQYGGGDFVTDCCHGCPANVSRLDAQFRWAGCYGWLYPPADAAAALQQLEATLAGVVAGAGWPEGAPVARPRFYGLWLQSPVPAALLPIQQTLWTELARTTAAEWTGIDEFRRALDVAAAGAAPLDVALFPAGEVAGHRWLLPPHCPRCRAPAPADATACQVCGRSGRPTPARRRKTRGDRPFLPLARFLGSQRAAELVARLRR